MWFAWLQLIAGSATDIERKPSGSPSEWRLNPRPENAALASPSLRVLIFCVTEGGFYLFPELSNCPGPRQCRGAYRTKIERQTLLSYGFPKTYCTLLSYLASRKNDESIKVVENAVLETGLFHDVAVRDHYLAPRGCLWIGYEES